jgi:hypothetical protein
LRAAEAAEREATATAAAAGSASTGKRLRSFLQAVDIPTIVRKLMITPKLRRILGYFSIRIRVRGNPDGRLFMLSPDLREERKK